MNRSKAKGTRFEVEVIDYLNAQGFNVERRALEGKNDRGDVAGMPGNMVVEIKNHNAMDLGTWMNEAEKEAVAAKVYRFVCWHKARGKPTRKSYVTMPAWVFVDMLHSARDFDSAALRP